MFDYQLDIDQELSEIPPEYQDAFRQALSRELADSEQNRTDADILQYLRQRRQDFQQGNFIRPDGRPGLVALNPETLYEQALPQLAQGSLEDEDNSAERRRLVLKLALFAGVALIFLFLAFRGRAQREAAAARPPETTPVAALATAGAPTPTPALPEITGADDSLQTIGGLGGALTIGRPSAIEIHYSQSEETVALAIDPSRPTTRGELRFNEAAMLSDNPVAVWVFGTVLNYAIGLPDSLVRNLTPGDRIRLNTDTGAALNFVVARTWQGSSHEAGRLLSQNRLGLTLFALPAAAESGVTFAFADYDVTGEEGQTQPVYGLGEPFVFSGGQRVEARAVQVSHTAQGALRVVVEGLLTDPSESGAILLSLTADRQQTTAVPLTPDDEGGWQADFTLSAEATGAVLLAEFRALPTGGLALVGLGDLPRLVEQLDIDLTGAWLVAAGDGPLATVSGDVHNPGAGAVYLGPDFIGLIVEGGDAYDQSWQVAPRLPLLLSPGETVGLTVRFPPRAASMRLQIGLDLWEIGFPPETDPHLRSTAVTP
jgi:hypothetical protein